jgi:hypothetical protein
LKTVAICGNIFYASLNFADMAQLVEQRTCNAQVSGSNPDVGSIKKQNPAAAGFFILISPFNGLRSIMPLMLIMHHFLMLFFDYLLNSIYIRSI